MRLLLLIPNILLLFIGGYNLSESIDTRGFGLIIHACVILISILFCSFIIRSMFMVKIETKYLFNTYLKHQHP